MIYESLDDIYKIICNDCDCIKPLGSGPSLYCFEVCIIYEGSQKKDRYYHPKCYLNSKAWRDHFDATSADLNEMEGFNSLSQKEQMELIKLLWPYQLPISMRSKAKLPKDIDEMSSEELRIELEKRDLPQ